MSEPVSRWLGSRTRLEYEALIEGELSDDELEEVVDEMRRSIGEFGNVSTVGRTITFTSQAAPVNSYPRKLQVSVSSRGGRTTLRAYEDVRQVASGVIWGITGGVGGGIGGVAFGVIMAATKGAAFAVAPFAFVGGRRCLVAGIAPHPSHDGEQQGSRDQDGVGARHAAASAN